jgi:hypothetical protein
LKSDNFHKWNYINRFACEIISISARGTIFKTQAEVFYSDIKHERAQLECFISDKARTACILNGLKTNLLNIGKIVLKINVV